MRFFRCKTKKYQKKYLCKEKVYRAFCSDESRPDSDFSGGAYFSAIFCPHHDTPTSMDVLKSFSLCWSGSKGSHIAYFSRKKCAMEWKKFS